MSGLVKQATFSHRMHCSECGSLLRLKSGDQVAKTDKLHPSINWSGDIVTFIEPCRECIETELAPARALKAALDLCFKPKTPDNSKG
jgi:hypothetical protein